MGQLGGVNSAWDSLATTTINLPVPPSATIFPQLQLSLKVRADTSDSPVAEYDSLACFITDASTGTLLHITPVLCSNQTAGLPWVETGENLPYDQYKGRKLRLTFFAQNDISLPTIFYIKDISLSLTAMFK